MRCVGFQTTLIRGGVDSATGKVSYPVPEDFPTASQIKLRPDDQVAAPEPRGFRRSSRS